jgi:hypothetical protein
MFIFLCFFSFIFFIQEGSYTARSNLASHSQFGFESGGSFSIEIYDCSLTSIIVNLLTLSKYNELKSSSSLASIIPISDISSLLNLTENKAHIFQGFIQKKDVYIVVYQKHMSVSGQLPYNISVKYQFSNPNSLLDFRWTNISYWIPIAIV